MNLADAFDICKDPALHDTSVLLLAIPAFTEPLRLLELRDCELTNLEVCDRALLMEGFVKLTDTVRDRYLQKTDRRSLSNN